jgi:tRNA A-37 threonylcarbamoyl transferase component Bud32
MEGKAFLKYLLQQHHLSKEQLKICYNESIAQNQNITQILLKYGYFTPDALKTCLTEFCSQEKSQSSSPFFTPHPAPPVSPKEAEEVEIVNEIKETTQKLQLKHLVSSHQKKHFFNDLKKQVKDTFKNLPIQEEESREGEIEDKTLVGKLSEEDKEDESLFQELELFIDKTSVHRVTQSVTAISQENEERYEIRKVLGSGGMGIVELALDTHLGREVALKRIREVGTSSQQLTQQQKIKCLRLQKEAAITAQLEHPNIVPLYDLQEAQGEFYFTMRKVTGETLRSILKNKPQYSEAELLSIYFKVCDAVAYAHTRNIIHRDLKPDNIMVGQFGEVYVMDWGLAKELENFLLKKTTKKSGTERKSYDE